MNAVKWKVLIANGEKKKTKFITFLFIERRKREKERESSIQRSNEAERKENLGKTIREEKNSK